MLGQRVLVTAGAAGIGRALAEAFLGDSASVFVCDLDEKALESVARELPGLHTGRCDVSKADEVAKEAMAVQSIKRMVDPKNIAALAVFLASDAAKFISGQLLPIDNDMQPAS